MQRQPKVSPPSQPLISVDASRGLLAAGAIAVDCRFDLMNPLAGRKAYESGHLPGARYADLDHDLAAPPRADSGRHPLPRPGDLAEKLGALGISNESLVIAYDDSGGALAARLWWLLRWLGHSQVGVLDGGLSAWRAAALPLEQGTPRWPRTRFVPVRVRNDWVVTTAEIPDRLSRGSVLIDARAAARFRGEEEPIDPVAGHVPGAVNLPFTELLNEQGRFRSPPSLRRKFLQLIGDRPADQVVAMCGSGITAAHLLLGLHAAGLGDGRLYAGSWSEWIRDPKRAVATGP